MAFMSLRLLLTRGTQTPPLLFTSWARRGHRGAPRTPPLPLLSAAAEEMRVSRTLRLPVVSLPEFVTPLATKQRARETPFSVSRQVVLRSNSHHINANLTAEEALVRGVLLGRRERLLLLYRNEPCVVVGRNQNLFQEVALRKALADGVRVARRSSGGGAVFQDMGNLCFSFFTPRSEYAPEKTIQIVRHGVSLCFGIALERLTTTKRYDLFLDGRKITGSAMRVQRDIAFHHCTLLLSTPVAGIGRYLKPEGVYAAFTSSSVGSVRSPVTTIAAGAPTASTGSTDVVQLTEHYMTDFFLRCGGFILEHAAPWELDNASVAAQLAASPAATVQPPQDPARASSLELDVASAEAQGGARTPLLMGEGRPASSSDCRTFRREVARLCSRDWQFAMPKFVTVVHLPVAELHDLVSVLVAENGAAVDGGTQAALTRLLHVRDGGAVDAQLCVRTTVEHRIITDIEARVQRGERAASPDSAEEAPWLTRFLRSMLVQCNCDAPVAGLLAASRGPTTREVSELEQQQRTALLQGLLMEINVSASDADELDGIPDEQRELCLLALVTAVIRLWRKKNVFDYAC